MAISEPFESALKLAARRASEKGRLNGALLRGAAAALLALTGFLLPVRHIFELGTNKGPGQWMMSITRLFPITIDFDQGQFHQSHQGFPKRHVIHPNNCT